MNTINSSPSFCGATKILKKHILSDKNTLIRFVNEVENGYIGSLPNEIIIDIIKLSKTQKEKETLIKAVMDGFSKTANYIYKEIDEDRENALTKVFYSIYAMFKKKKMNNVEFKYVPPYTPEEKNKIGQSASLLLTKTLIKTGILKKGETVSLNFIGDGSYKNVFSLKFPQRTGYTPKVMGIFKPFPKDCFDIEDTMTHGKFPELNMLAYINNRHQKNSPFVKNYFGSIKDNFILSENANFLKPARELNENIFMKMNLIHWDLTPDNIVNGWIIDLGGLKIRNRHKINPH